MSAAQRSRHPTEIETAKPSSYPDVERLVADGDLVKIGPGYSVQTEIGVEAIGPYIVGLSIGRNDKPTVYRFARRVL